MYEVVEVLLPRQQRSAACIHFLKIQRLKCRIQSLGLTPQLTPWSCSSRERVQQYSLIWEWMKHIELRANSLSLWNESVGFSEYFRPDSHLEAAARWRGCANIPSSVDECRTCAAVASPSWPLPTATHSMYCIVYCNMYCSLFCIIFRLASSYNHK